MVCVCVCLCERGGVCVYMFVLYLQGEADREFLKRGLDDTKDA